MNTNILKISILILAIIFLLISFFIKVPEGINNIIYGFMSVFSLLFLFFKRKEFKIDNMFERDNEEEDEI